MELIDHAHMTVSAKMQFQLPHHLREAVRDVLADGARLAEGADYETALRRWLIEEVYCGLAASWPGDRPACLDWSDVPLADQQLQRRLGLRPDYGIDDELRIAYGQDILAAAFDGDLADEREGRCWPALLYGQVVTGLHPEAIVVFVAKAGADPKADPDLIGISDNLSTAFLSLQQVGLTLCRGPVDITPADILLHWQR